MSSKVKDGLFLGDIDAAQDAEFLQLNGIVHIINCVPRQVPNLFQQSLGLDYVACDLDEVLKRPFFDLKNRQFMGIVQLIERALEKTESVLVHSLNGINRSPSVMMGFLMVKYCWGVDKAYEFLLTKRSDIKPHESYIDQLCLLEAQLQGRFGSRATEQQLYEWHPTLADPLTDEIVLVHTFLNTPSTANKPGAKKDPVKPPGTRRLSWIDQIPQMKKLYPSLMIKPERPPNNSYSDMVPANGWVDLLAPPNPSSTAANANDSAVAVPRPIAAFMETPVTKTSAPLTSDLVDADDDTATVNRGHRVHSFSVPRRREIELDNPLSPTSSDKDDSDLMIDVAPLLSTALTSSKQALIPRYQQQIRSTTLATGRPSRQAQSMQQQPTTTARPSANRGSLSSAMSSMTVSATFPTSTNRLAGSFGGPSSSGGVTSTVMTSSFNRSSVAKTLENSKPSKPTMRATSTTTKLSSATAPKPSLERRSSGSSSTSGSNSARGTYTGDLPLPQTSSAFTIRRSIIDTEPWTATATFPSSTASSTNRPRTAPPRLRKKDADVSSSSAAASTSKSSGGGLNRVNMDVWSLPTNGSRRLSTATDFNGPSARPQKTTTTATKATATATAAAASAARSRPARAQWK